MQDVRLETGSMGGTVAYQADLMGVKGEGYLVVGYMMQENA